MDEMEWSDRTKFRRKFIHPLIKENLLAMTIPENPNTPYQKYITTKKGNELLKKVSEQS